MEYIDAFPTQIWVDTTDNIDNKTLAKFILNEQKTSENVESGYNLYSASFGSWQSHSELYKDFSEEIHDTISELDCLIKKMTNEIVVNNEYKKDIQIQYQGMWANINGYKDYNKSHVHPGCDWSGVYYIKTPKNCGQLWFTDPRLARHMLVQTHLYDDKKVFGRFRGTHFGVVPKVGRLVMFPSFLEHEVDPNESHEPRISISFNIKLN